MMTDLSKVDIDTPSLASAIADWMVEEYTAWRDDDPNNPTIDADAPPPTLYQLGSALAAKITADS